MTICPPPSGARLLKWIACAAAFCLQPRFGGFGGRCRSATAALVFLLLCYNTKQAEARLSRDSALAVQPSKEIEMLESNRNEQWRDVVGYEGIYSVSDHGSVKRDGQFYGCHAGTILKGCVKRGYIAFLLCDGRRNQNWKLAHRLVAEAFISICPSGYQCNHKNGRKDDNHVDNLEWVTASQNRRHAIDILKVKISRGETQWFSKLTESDVHQIRKQAADGENQSKIAKQFGIYRQHVSAIHLRKRWTWLA